MSLLTEALEIRETLIDLRHYFHQNPEIGMDLPVTVKKVKETLSALGIRYDEIIPDGGVKAYIGKNGGRTILLRADMDALPIEEKTGLEYASKNKGVMHACGHDLHNTMLLGAAMLLKNHEHELNGQVILMFQPGEEGYDGALRMIEAGILEPKPDYAAAIHIAAFEEYETGVVVASLGTTYAARDGFEVAVQGKGGHGAQPENSKNSIYGAIKIIEAFTDMVKYEIDSAIPAVLTVCQINAGTADNIIPEQCRFSGTLRTVNEEKRAYLLLRMNEIVKGICDAYCLKGELLIPSSLPELRNDEVFTRKVHSWITKDLEGVQAAPLAIYTNMGSEDFALVSQAVPSCYLHLISRSPKGRHYPEHNENVVFDDEAVVYGAAVYAQIAVSYFKHEE